MSLDERHISQFVQNLVERFYHIGEDSFDLDTELSELRNPITHEVLDEEDNESIKNRFLTRINYKISHDTAKIVPISVIEDPRLHEEWYGEWIGNNNNEMASYYWKRLENYLESELTRKYGPESAGKVVKSIDEATSKTIQKLANPARREFNHKGLVVGYVQSGKTANFTALIAKAVDAGYKFIVVLAGIHNMLRKQTQIRLDRELTGENDFNLPNFINIPSAAKKWNRLTTARNDFSTTNISSFTIYQQQDTPILAVVKKNVGVLNRLIEYISESTAEIRDNIPMLIIDDEADQASIDTNAGTDSDPTSTNRCIRLLLSKFNKKTYVGYTATPFANVLINMTSETIELGDDLYPRNFIVSLPEPEGYFGTSSIFQGELSEKFVTKVPDEANEFMRKSKMTESLSTAIDLFLVSCAIRNIRGNKLSPMSMLVHVSRIIPDMEIITRIVNEYINDIKARYNNQTENSVLKDDFQKNWNKFRADAETINQELALQNEIPDFDNIWSEISNVLDKISILELNSQSEDVLDYTTDEEIKVIAIGGNQLSRGLTLEGLMTSYYLRSSRQYDTLLQMGRWFGYRPGYEDLTRIYTSDQIFEFFEHLALVEAELRSEIYRYEEEGKTPAEVAMAIRDHQRLTVTAPNKMRSATFRQISYSESLNQTIWFPLNKPRILENNFQLGNDFIHKINDKVGFTNIDNRGVFLANEKIDGQIILKEFLNLYTFADKDDTGGPGLDSERLLSYIFRRLDDQNPELTQWSVALAGSGIPNANIPILDYGGIDINRIQRSRKFTLKGYNVGVLTSKEHLRIDLAPDAETPFDGRTAQNPLLLLYPIWHGSRATKQIEIPQLNERIDLYRFVETEKIDVLGLAIILPKSDYEPNNYISQL